MKGRWIVDFMMDSKEGWASWYVSPSKYILKRVARIRAKVRNPLERRRWWVHGRCATDMRKALAPLQRYIATSRVAKHRIFVWLSPDVLPDGEVIAFARSDDYFLGVLQSRPHTLWALAKGTQLREQSSGTRYTSTTCFETFPLPWEPGAEPQGDPRFLAIAEAARELNALREGWLNPAEEIAPSELKKRTLTNLYNQDPAWLQIAHRKLDEAVFAAYNWPTTLSDQEILARLLALNLQRAGGQEPPKASPGARE